MQKRSRYPSSGDGLYLRSQDYAPPERTLGIVSGAGTVVGSFFGPMGVPLSLPATALTASPDAGGHAFRHRASYVAAGVGLIVALAAGFATELVGFIPAALLDGIVGLAVLGILAQSLQVITKGPLLLGPLVGIGRFFWALTLGITASLLLERSAWRSTTSQQP